MTSSNFLASKFVWMLLLVAVVSNHMVFAADAPHPASTTTFKLAFELDEHHCLVEELDAIHNAIEAEISAYLDAKQGHGDIGKMKVFKEVLHDDIKKPMRMHHLRHDGGGMGHVPEEEYQQQQRHRTLAPTEREILVQKKRCADAWQFYVLPNGCAETCEEPYYTTVEILHDGTEVIWCHRISGRFTFALKGRCRCGRGSLFDDGFSRKLPVRKEDMTMESKFTEELKADLVKVVMGMNLFQEEACLHPVKTVTMTLSSTSDKGIAKESFEVHN